MASSIQPNLAAAARATARADRAIPRLLPSADVGAKAPDPDERAEGATLSAKLPFPRLHVHLHGRHCRCCCGAYASAQSRSRALGARRDPRSQRRLQPRGAGHRQRDFYRDAHRRIFDAMVALNERSQAIDFVTLKEELARGGRARRRRRSRVRRLARRRRAARDQRRVLRAHRQGEGDAAEPDLRGEQDPRPTPTRPTRKPT